MFPHAQFLFSNFTKDLKKNPTNVDTNSSSPGHQGFMTHITLTSID